MIIRMAEEKDLQGILDLYAQPGMDSEVLDIETAKDLFKKMKLYPDYHIYAAEQDGKIIGTFELAVMDNLAHMGGKSGLIEDVVVAEDVQGQGRGKEMLRFAIDKCREKGCYKLSLSSNMKREKAHKFYEWLGFHIHGYSFSMDLTDADILKTRGEV